MRTVKTMWGAAMSAIARRLTGLTKEELREYNFVRVRSKAQVYRPRTINLRQNVRFASGMMVGSDDLDQTRQKLAEKTPKALR
jgi:hypothetical protein